MWIKILKKKEEKRPGLYRSTTHNFSHWFSKGNRFWFSIWYPLAPLFSKYCVIISLFLSMILPVVQSVNNGSSKRGKEMRILRSKYPELFVLWPIRAPQDENKKRSCKFLCGLIHNVSHTPLHEWALMIRSGCDTRNQPSTLTDRVMQQQPSAGPVRAYPRSGRRSGGTGWSEAVLGSSGTASTASGRIAKHITARVRLTHLTAPH